MSDLVTVKIAEKLKEKGFPQHICDTGYIIENNEKNKYNTGDKEVVWKIPKDYMYIAAPTIAQALKWLRETGIHINTEICVSGWYCSIYSFNKDETGLYDINDTHLCVGSIYDNYEKATIAAIEYTLDKLI